MVERDRITAIYLGALLLDGIIPADLKIIEETIVSLNRAAHHIDFASPDVHPDMAAIQAFSALKTTKNDTDTDPYNAS